MAKKMAIPCEFKYELSLRGWTSMLGGFLYVIRERHGAAEALASIERFFRMKDRVANLVNTIKTIFKIEGNDAETMAKWFDAFFECLGSEYTIPERSKTIFRIKVTKCPFKTVYKDISDWCRIWQNIVVKTINSKVTSERPQSMCAGDPYCEYISKIEELG